MQDDIPPPVLGALGDASRWPEPGWLRAVAGNQAYEWARLAWRRSAVVPGAWFDAAKADAAVALWPKVFRLTEDRFAGKPFRLNVWQEIIVRLLVGWKVPITILDEETGRERSEHVRLFRRLMLWVPRKNGKSEFLAALGLLFFLLEGTVAGQGFAFARDEDQARVVFDKMKAMIALDAAGLAKAVQPYKRSFYVPQIRATFRVLSGSGDGKHGLSPTVIVGDEMHEWATLDVATFLRQGTGARLQPIELYASTAGLKSKVIGYGLWEESLGLLEGRIVEPTTLVAMFAAGPDDDWQDEAVWARANPSLGLSPTLAFLRREAALAKDNPRAEMHFRRYHLNQWVEALTRWLPLKVWDGCMSDPSGWMMMRERMCGRRCFGALDVSSTQDVTALVWLFPPEDGETAYSLIARFWVPEETVPLRVRQDRVPYDRWVAAGVMETTPGNSVDQDFVGKAILEGMRDFAPERIGFDPWNARKLVGDLTKTGVPEDVFVEMRQGIQTLGEPTKQFERLVYAGEIDHGGNPVLRWMAGNAVVRFDENANFMVAKKRSAEKVDGIAAAVMAAGLALSVQPDTSSVYEDRGIRVV